MRGVNKAFTIGVGASILDWLVLPVIHHMRSALNDAVIRLETLRSRSLVEAVSEGVVDFAIVREDALPKGARRHPVQQIRFHLCVPRLLLKRGTSPADIDDPQLWKTLSFTAGKDGGQLDLKIRQIMTDAGVDFRPLVECNSMLQARQLIEQGVCAGILPSAGIHGLDPDKVIIRDFAPLKKYGRHLVLHWNERHMRRRGVEPGATGQMGQALQKGQRGSPPPPQDVIVAMPRRQTGADKPVQSGARRHRSRAKKHLPRPLLPP